MTPPSLEQQISNGLETLEASPGDAGAFATLESLLRENERWEELVRLYESGARHGADPTAAAGMLAKAADVARRRLRDRVRTEALYRQLLHADPRHPTALLSLAELHEERGDWASLTEALERQADRTRDPRTSALLYLRLGRVWEQQLLRRDRAALFYARASRIDPALGPARDGALACFVALRRYGQAKRMLDAARERGGEPKQLAAEYARLGGLLVDEPLDHGLAMDALIDALSLDRGAPGAAQALERLRTAPRAWRDQAAAITAEAGKARERRTAALLYLHAAGLHAAYDPDGAPRVAELVHQALTLWPGMVQGLDFLERWHAERQDWRGAHEALSRLATGTRDRAALAAIHLRLAHLEIVRFGDQESALVALEKVLEADPASETAAQQAFELHVDAGRPAQALAALERHLAAAPQKPQHVPLRLRAAEMATSLGDRQKARQHLEAAQRVDPRSPSVAAALSPFLAAAGEWRRLAEALEIRAAAEPVAASRARLLEQLAEIQRDKLRSPRDAVRQLIRALLLDPGRAVTRKALEGVAAEAGVLAELARACRMAAGSPRADARAKRTLLRRSAEIWDGELGRPEEALRAWRDLAALDPGDEEVASAIQDCLARTGQHAEATEGLEERLATAAGPERHELLARLARSQQDAGDAEEAAKAWRVALDAGHDSLVSLRGLAEALEALGPAHAEELVVVLGHLSARLSGAERGEVDLQRAALLAEPLDRPVESAGILLAVLRAGGLTPGQIAEATASLEELLQADVEPVRIAQVLAPLYAAAGDAGKHVAMLELLAQRLPQDDDGRERARLLLDAAAIRDKKLGDARGALSAAEAALRACPTHAEARKQCERLAARAGAFGEIHALFVETARRLANRPDEERILRLRAAQIAEQELGSASEAVTQLRRCLELSPGNPDILAALTRIAFAGERWEEGCDLLLERSGLAQGEERTALLAQLADTMLERLKSPAGAAEVYRQALGVSSDEHRPRLLAKLADALAAAGDTQGRAGALDELARVAPDPEQAARAAAESAQLQAVELGDPRRAVEQWRAACQRNPGDEKARAGLLELTGSEDPEVARAAAAALAPAAEASGDLRTFLAALGVLARTAGDPSERASVERRIARVQADLGKWPEALEALSRVVRVMPLDADVRGELRTAAEKGHAAARCAAVYDEILAQVQGEPALPILHELASWCEEQLGHREKAAACLTRVVALAPADKPALAGLRRLHRAAERWPELVSTCLRLAAVAEAVHERVDAWREAAAVAEARLGDGLRAAEIWNEVLEAAPGDPEALGALERVWEARGDAARLAEVLARRRARPGGERDVELAFRLAELHRTRLDAPGEALALHGAVLRADPTHAGSAGALVELAAIPGPLGREALAMADAVLRARGEHGARAEARERRLAAVADPNERARLFSELRAILERDLGRSDLALDAAERAFAEGGPGREESLAQLEALAESVQAFDRLARVLEQAAAEEGPGAVDLLRRAARVRESRLADPDAAIAAWAKVREREPDDPEALDALERLYGTTRQARELADLARRRADLAEGPDKAAHLVHLGELEESLGNAGPAIAACEAALAVEPSNGTALESLARLYRRERLHAKLAWALHTIADRLREDPPARLDLLAERATVLEEDPAGAAALDAWAEVLSEARNDPRAVAGLERLLQRPAVRDGAARLLEQVYRHSGDGRRLAAVLESKLESAAAGERAALLAELAAIHERLGQRPLAFQARAMQWRDAAASGAEDPSLRAEMERIAAESGAWEDLARAYEEALQGRLAGPARAEVARRLGSLLADPLERPDQAARWLEEAASASPDAETLGALGRIYRRQSAFRELASVQRRQAALAATPEGRKEHLLEVARIMEEQISDREGAIEAYRQILSVDPADAHALRLLGKLLAAAERWDELAQVLAREVALAERDPALSAEAAEIRLRLGRIRQQRLGDVAGALADFREVLERVPKHPGALAALEELVRSGGTASVEAAAVLEPIYSGGGDHAKLVEALEARVGATPEPASRAALLSRIAEIYAQALHNPELGFLAASRALREVPDSTEALDQATRLAEASGLPEELSALLGEVADRVRGARTRAEYRRRLAQLAVRGGGDPRRAAEAWTQVLELAPDDQQALVGLSDALRAAGDGDGLVQVLRRRLAVEEEPSRRAALLAELAQVQEERQKDLAGAMATLRRLLELDPTRRDALTRLDRLCVQLERWVELAEVLAREIASADASSDGGAALALRYRLAELRETRLLDRDGAVALHEEILAARPDHAESLAHLEAVLAREPSNARTAQALQKAFSATGRWDRYASVLEVRAGQRPDPLERKVLFAELAEVREKRLNGPELAFLALCRAFHEDPSDPAVRAGLSRLAAVTEHHEELAAVLEDEFERLPPSAAAEVALELGALHEARLASPPRAIEWLERARQLDPSTASVALPALDRMYRKASRWPELAGVLRDESERAGGEERGAFLLRLGQLCEEKLDDAPGAARAYEALVAEDPGNLPALRALEKLYEGSGRLDALAANLAAQRAVAADQPSRTRLAARMADVAGQLGQDEEAIGLWREVLAQDTRHEPAMAALEVLYQKHSRWPDLAELLRARLAHTPDRREVARINDKLGWILGRKLGDAAEAVRSFQAVLEAEPGNRRALESLRDIHTAQGDLEALAGVYRRLIPLQEDAAGVKAVRLKLAEVLLKADKRSEAVEQGKRALELEPHSEGDLGRIAALFDEAGAQPERVRAIEARAALLASAGRVGEAVGAWLAAAEAWEKSLGKVNGAAAALEKVLELDPESREAFGRLRDLYARTGSWRAWVRVCDAFVPRFGDRADRTALLRELAEVHEKRLGQKDMAFLTLCRAFQEDPGQADVAAGVQRLAAETRSFDELSAVYEQLAEEARGVVKARLLLELGRIRDGRLEDPDGAEMAFRKALEADPASPEALDALTGLFTRRGRVRDLVITLEQKLEAAAGLDEKKATLLEMARIYDGQLGDAEEAVSSLRRVLELDGGDTAAIQALAAIYRRERRWAELAGILARARDLAADDAARIDYQLQIAGVYENELGDQEAAVEEYRSALGLDDRRREALAGLERLYTRLDRFAELNRVYERQVELADDPSEKVRVLCKSASIWEEKLHNQPKAIECNERILALDGENLGAAKSLENLYRREAQWEKLIAVMQHHATLTQDRRELVALHVAIGEVLWKELGRIDRADAVFSQALQIDPDAREAVSALGGLYERSGNWNPALEMLQREVKLAAAGPEAVEIYARIGRIQEEMLQDRAAAKAAYARAVDLDPGHLASLRALRSIAESEGQRDQVLELLVAEARYTKADAERARLLFEAGRILETERRDPDGAERHYEEALKRQPDLLEAARPLADLYVARSAWDRAESVLDVLVRRLAAEGDAKELCRQSYRLAYVCEKLSKRAKALDSYRRAYELDPTYLPALEGLGNLLVQDQAWEEALRIYQAILIHHRDGLTDLEVVETYWQIGEIQARLGQPERAAKSYEKALEIDIDHEPSRRSLIAILEAQGEWEPAVEHRQRLLPLLDGKAKLDMHLAIGRICRDELDDPYQAIDAFGGAAKLDPGSLPITEALLGLYRETRQGQKAADVLQRLIESPEVKADPPRAAKLHHALGQILRDEVKDEAGAARELERALEADPRLVAAFADLEALLTAGRRWGELEQAYVRMIQRLPKGPEAAAARLALWKTLGELYRRVLDNAEGARMAWGVVAKADPEDLGAVEAHADLAARSAGHEEEAIAGYRQLVRLGGPAPKAVSALVGLHVARKEYDQAYTAAQVAAFLLTSASADEQQVAARLRRYARDAANQPLTEALWRERLMHEKVRGPLAGILGLLAREASGVFTHSPRELGFDPKKDEVDVASSMLFFVNMFKYVARTLGFPAPRLFRSASQSGTRLRLVPTAPLALVATEDLFQERPKKELWFTIGKAMTFLRPELMLARLMPHEQLETVFQAACSLGTSRFVVTADPFVVEKIRRRLEQALPERTRTQELKKLAREYCQVQHPGDLRAFADGAELTSNRAGALLAGDLDVARRGVTTEKAQASKLREETRLRDLVQFCTSEDYAALRRQLGLSVVVTGV